DYDTAVMAQILSEETKIPYQIAKNYGLHAVLKCFPVEKIHHFIKIYQEKTKTLPKEFRNMDLEKIREVQQSGLITIGAHTLSHPILANETDADSKMEIVQSIKDLAQLINQEIKYFAYPNGTFGLDFGRREMEILQKNNIKIAVSTEPNFVNKNSEKMAFPRKGITLGSIRFIKMKIFLGKKWNYFKNFGKQSEAQKREILKKFLEK
ncbi:MAG: polysaccharide deacetylase family protein, partial [Paludibacter sp.]|nr:polysaccharide deacetylase family protein [Paludibacter sp.]